MGQQLNKLIKRRRRKAYVARKKALAKQGIVRSKAPRPKATEEKKEDAAAKKAAAKKPAKAPAAKKAEKAAEETTEAAAE